MTLRRRRNIGGRKQFGRLALGGRIRLLHPGGAVSGMDPCDSNVCDVCQQANKIRGIRTLKRPR